MAAIAETSETTELQAKPAETATPPAETKVELTAAEKSREALKAIDAGETDPSQFDVRISKAVEAKAAKKSGKDERKPDEPVASSSGSPASSDTTAGESAEKAVLAKMALKRDGWTDAEIADLPEATRIKVGMKAKAAQDERQRRFDEQRRATHPDRNARAKTEGGDADPGSSGVRSGADPAESALDDAEGLDPVLDLLDEEDKAKVKTTVAELRDRATKAESEARVALFESVRHGLQSKFPMIMEDSEMVAVLNKMRTLDPGGEILASGRDALTSLMLDAAELVLGPKLKEQARRERSERTKETLNGQPDVGNLRAGESGPPSQQERERVALRAIEEHPGDEARQRAYMDRHLGRV